MVVSWSPWLEDTPNYFVLLENAVTLGRVDEVDLEAGERSVN